jgi:hypothetical protein
MRTARKQRRRSRRAAWAALLAAAAMLIGGGFATAWGAPGAKAPAAAAQDDAAVPMVQYDNGLKTAKAKAETKVKAAVTASNDVAGMLAGQPVSAAPAGKATTPRPGVKPGAAAAPRSAHAVEERHLLNREVYVYKTVGRRDPFASLLEGEFETTVGNPLLDVSSMKLVGIVWGASDTFALVEDGRGHGHVLRVGDPVINGYVVGLTKQELLIRQTSYGDSQTVTIQLQRKEGSSDEK